MLKGNLKILCMVGRKLIQDQYALTENTDDAENVYFN